MQGGEVSVDDECDSEKEEQATENKVTHQTVLTHIEWIFDYMAAYSTLNGKFTVKDARSNLKKNVVKCYQIRWKKTQAFFLDMSSETMDYENWFSFNIFMMDI